PVAASKLTQLLAADADVLVVAPDVHPLIAAAAETSAVTLVRREFLASDLDGAWLVVAAAPPAVNREVAGAAEQRRLLVNAVDDPPNASAYLGGVVRRDGVVVAISTSGAAPAIAGLMREAIDEILPADLTVWMDVARDQRVVWKREGVPMEGRRPLLLQALNRLYEERSEEAEVTHAPVQARR
ncbi:MAG: NAD(P)-dependent oxidoreductase, partial [Vicinamibacterales bacterium]